MKKIIVMYLLLGFTLGIAAMNNEKASRATQRLKAMIFEEGGGSLETLFLMGKKEEIKKLIKQGADTSLEDAKGSTLLIRAAMEHDHDFLIFLLNNRANPNHPNRYKFTPLMATTSLDHRYHRDAVLKSIGLLIDAGADRDLKEMYQNYTAADCGKLNSAHPEAIQLLKEEQKRKIL